MSRNGTSRRRFLGVTAAMAAGLAGCSGGSSSGSGGETTTASGGDATTASGGDSSGGGSKPSFDGWLSGVSNYTGVVDETGKSEVTVEVGVEANGGYFGFGPAAVRVSPGTKVVWKWTGKGSSHNVVAKDGSFSSELVTEAGYTYSQTFSESGTVKYYCEPHKTLGMKGVVVVEG